MPFDERKVDFLRDEKLALYFEMLQEMREAGVDEQKIHTLEKQVTALIGKAF